MYVYDLECFPNFFSGVFQNTEDPTDTREFVIHESRDDSPQMISFLEGNPSLAGYNNHEYDDLLANLIKKRKTNSTTRLYKASQHIINTDSLSFDKKTRPLLYSDFYSIDLMKVLGFDKLKIGLKHVAVKLRHPLIQDLPKHHTEKVTADEIPEIVAYNHNDVHITSKLYHKLGDQLNMRREISKLYDLDIMSSSDSVIADQLMAKFYCDHTQDRWYDIKEEQTQRSSIPLSDVVADDIYFTSDRLQQTLQRIKNYEVEEGVKKDTKIDKVKFGYSWYDIGVGGLHSGNRAAIHTNEEADIIDVDVDAYYPSLAINLEVRPAHLRESFPEVYKSIVAERLRAKSNKDHDPIDSVKNDVLKISINSVFGKMGYQNSWLYDLKALYTITINGQLYLLMLIEWLEQQDFPIIYANTDGLTAKVPYDRKDEFYGITASWEEYTNLSLEYNNYRKTVLRDVNNYLIIKADGGVKEKGAFITKRSKQSMVDQLKHAFVMPVLAEAVHQYFVNGIQPQHYIPYHEDIFDFCMSQKVGKQYDVLLSDLSGMTELQKINRFYVATKGGKMCKYKREEDRYENLVKGKTVQLLNNYCTNVTYDDVDYSYYIAEAWKMISDCTNAFQQDLFS